MHIRPLERGDADACHAFRLGVRESTLPQALAALAGAGHIVTTPANDPSGTPL